MDRWRMILGMRYLILVLMMVSVGAKAQIPSHTHMVGDCAIQANDAIHIFSEQVKAPEFELYVICNQSDWSSAMVKNGLRPSETALTDWQANRIWLGPKSFTDPLHLREVIAHELEHLRCHCNLGEINPHSH
jgi:hypothetical protein